MASSPPIPCSPPSAVSTSSRSRSTRRTICPKCIITRCATPGTACARRRGNERGWCDEEPPDWLAELPCPVLRLDGSRPLPELIAEVRAELCYPVPKCGNDKMHQGEDQC